jgi:hypothetical protein
MEEKRKSSSQTQQAQAQSGKTRGDRSPQGPPTKKARLVESPSRQNEHAQSRRFKSSMSSVAKQNIEALHQGIRPKNIFDGPTPSPDKHFMDKAFDQINGSIQGLSSSSPPKKTHDSDTAKVQPLQLRKSDTLTPTQVKESSAKNLNIIKEIRESDSAQNLPADQSSKTEVPVRKFTADIWEVSDDESDTPEEEAAKEEMKLTVGDIFGACVSQIAKHLAGPQKVAEASTTSSHETSREETPVQRLTENLPKFETKFRTVEKAYKEAEATLEAVKSKANEAAKSLDGFETKTRNELDGILTLDRKVGERWTFEAIRSQAAAFQTFGFVKRRELLDVQVPIREEKDARKNFEQAEAEYEKRRKKMALLNQAAEAFDED